MSLDRRDFLLKAPVLPFAFDLRGTLHAQQSSLPSGTGSLVPRADFPGVQNVCYLNSAQKHPMSIYAARALKDYAEHNLTSADVESSAGPADAATLAAFANLIGAEPSEISFVPSTMSAENLLLAGLGFPGARGNIVTDDLHYDGAIYLYEQLAVQGVEVRRIHQKNGAIDEAEMTAAIDTNTRVVAFSLVASTNGFQHDLNVICKAAHAHGALVYADIIQAVGAIPINVRESGVDICAASTHKWLMADKGLGFLYVRKDVLESGRLKGTQFGWKQIAADHYPLFTSTKISTGIAHFQRRAGTVGQFEVGTYALGPMACVAASMAYLTRIGIDRIHAHAQRLAEPLRRELPKLGYPLLSSSVAAPHITVCSVPDHAIAQRKLAAANVRVRMAPEFMRISVSVFNSEQDIATLLNALS